MSFPSWRLGLIIAVALLTSLFGAASASAAAVVNGDFETGTLEGWNLYRSSPEVRWEVVEPTGSPLPPPFSGRHVAVSTQEDPGAAILSQEIALEPNATHQLEFTFGYYSEAPIFVPNPDSLDAEGVFENQQVRVDVMKSTAPITSVSPSDILATAFASSEGENTEGSESEPELSPRRFSVNLSAFAGQTVRLRFSVAVTRAPLFATVDNVSVTSVALPPPPPPPPAPPSNVFTTGKLTLNKKSGAGFLSVSLPGAGTLTSTDVKQAVAVATAKGRKKTVLIKTATVTSTAVGTVKVPIKPTGAGKKILAKKGKLAFKVMLTFSPTGGTAATQNYSGKLVKVLKPARR